MADYPQTPNAPDLLRLLAGPQEIPAIFVYEPERLAIRRATAHSSTEGLPRGGLHSFSGSAAMSFDVNLGNDIFLTYGTPVMRYMVADAAALNAGLKRILREQEAAHPELRTGGRSYSNHGGWRSNPDLFDWPGAEIAALRAEVESAVTRMTQLSVGNDPARAVRPELSLAAWANINRDGDYNVMHNHAGNHWSGAYYVSLGEPDEEQAYNGWFEFYDPRPAAGMLPVPGFNFGLTLPLPPEEGLMLVFPSWHQHAVHPFRGKGERISISFNAFVRRLVPVPR